MGCLHQVIPGSKQCRVSRTQMTGRCTAILSLEEEGGGLIGLKIDVCKGRGSESFRVFALQSLAWKSEPCPQLNCLLLQYRPSIVNAIKVGILVVSSCHKSYISRREYSF
jgi:hypothetical protein